jgi:hypothetical protein
MTDPTNTITTGQQAQVLARAMLRLAPHPAAELCQLFSEPILTVLLHAASPARDGGGLVAVETALDTLAEQDGPATARVLGVDRAEGQRLSYLDKLTGRQRESVIATIRAAVSPWMAAWI